MFEIDTWISLGWR